ncbi:peptidase S8/S53 domain-containing protein [Glomus cerebriforme]|uniref:Peptidase S8/S53 domain-containing protein n=1 Tax=Glomus cerebriforme TaxID=658196 RepID=A0A397T3P9_9GLOM|nr:peptidase S8/S53 domain-containing protein [Glomus cerebriforme]
MNIYQSIFLLIIYLASTINSIPLNEINEEKKPYIVILKPKNNAVSTTSSSNANMMTSNIQNDDLYQNHLTTSLSNTSNIESYSLVKKYYLIITNFLGMNLNSNNNNNDIINLSPQTHQHKIIHEFAIGDDFRGYVGLFEPKFVNEILSNRDDVELIAPDSEVQVAYDLDDFSCNLENFGIRKQENPTWIKKNMFSATGGRNVNIYVIDTGINVNHTDFEGRSFVGHGTHIAGIVCTWKKGTGNWGDVIAGMTWIAQQHRVNSRKRTIVTQIITNDSVKALVDLEIHVTVAAGNYFDANSCYSSPATAPEVALQTSMILFQHLVMVVHV